MTITRIALLAGAAFLASPALIGAVDAWTWIVIGRAVLVEWDEGRYMLALLLAALAVPMFGAAVGLP